MNTRILLGLTVSAAMGCVSSDGAYATPEAEEQPVAQGLHQADGGSGCFRSYFVVKDKRVAQVPRDDVELIDTLVPHHQAAVEMASMEIEHGENSDIKAMAEEMKSAQSGEIEQLRAIRERLSGCSEVPALRDRHMQQDMEAMMNVQGAQLDRMFLEEMIPHHASALSFTHNALPKLEDAELSELAHKVIDVQSMEIGHMHMTIMELEKP